MNLYFYEGPVMKFDKCICKNWYGETMAVSEKKARSNLTFQFKKQNNYIASSKIFLPGKVQLYS